jgi:adenosine/AMP kinase
MEIRKRFGDAVAGIVDGTSDTDVMPKAPWRERKELARFLSLTGVRHH